jgi:hypothetical protein
MWMELTFELPNDKWYVLILYKYDYVQYFLYTLMVFNEWQNEIHVVSVKMDNGKL